MIKILMTTVEIYDCNIIDCENTILKKLAERHLYDKKTDYNTISEIHKVQYSPKDRTSSYVILSRTFAVVTKLPEIIAYEKNVD